MLCRDPRTVKYVQLRALAEAGVAEAHKAQWMERHSQDMTSMCLEMGSVRQGRGAAHLLAKAECCVDHRVEGEVNEAVHRRRYKATSRPLQQLPLRFVSSAHPGCQKRGAQLSSASARKREHTTRSPVRGNAKRRATAYKPDPSSQIQARPRVERHEDAGADGKGCSTQALAAQDMIANDEKQCAKTSRTAELAELMEQLGKRAAAKVSAAQLLKKTTVDLAKRSAQKRAERLTALDEGRRARLVASVKGHTENVRVENSVYCKQMARPADSRCIFEPLPSRPERAPCDCQLRVPPRAPFCQLSAGFFR
jgi:hypothetical protein